jgi:hypothetical protein
MGSRVLTADKLPAAGTGRIQLLRRSAARLDPTEPEAADGVPRDGGAARFTRWSSGSFLLALTICLLLVVGSVSWRQKVFFDGDLDPVVVAKAAVTGLALLFCLHARMNGQRANPVGHRTMTLLALFVVVSTVGGWAAGSGTASAILAVRVLMVGVAAYLLVRSFPVDVLLRALFIAMAVVGLVAVVTGVLNLGSTGGRLQGGIPPLAANEIAFLCGVPALALIWRYLSHRGRGLDLVLIVVLVGAVWASESRTGLAALLVAAVIMLLQARRISPGVVAAVIVAAGAVLYVLLTSDLLSAYFGRSNQGSVATLNSRTIAWSAALDLPQNAVTWWMGGGLALKQIPVQGQYWNVQGLDSSWVSAWVQGGLLCLLLLAVWVLSALAAGCRTPQPYRMLITGMLLFLVIRSFLESGLIDATPSFLLFMTMSMLAEAGTRPTLVAAAACWVAPAKVPRRRRAPAVHRALLRR